MPVLHLGAFLLFDRENKDVRGAVHDATGVLVENLRLRFREENPANWNVLQLR